MRHMTYNGKLQKAEVMGRWLRIARLGVNLDEMHTPLLNVQELQHRGNAAAT